MVAHGRREAIAEVAARDARIIAILREPASFLRSLHLQLVQNHVETETDLRTAIALEAAAREGRQHPAPLATGRSCCCTPSTSATSSSCAATTRSFPREQVLVLIYDDFRATTRRRCGAVLRFLGVDDDRADRRRSRPTRRAQHALAAARRHRARGLGRRAGPLRGAVKAAVKAVHSRRRCGAARCVVAQRRRRARAARPPDEELMMELRRRFKPEVVALSEYLDRDLVYAVGL